jgi:hypothetical protein
LLPALVALAPASAGGASTASTTAVASSALNVAALTAGAVVVSHHEVPWSSVRELGMRVEPTWSKRGDFSLRNKTPPFRTVDYVVDRTGSLLKKSGQKQPAVMKQKLRRVLMM